MERSVGPMTAIVSCHVALLSVVFSAAASAEDGSQFLQKAEELYKKQDWQQAVIVLRKVPADSTAFPDACGQALKVMLSIGMKLDNVNYGKSCVDANATQPLVRSMYAVHLQRMGNFNDALSEINQAHEIDPKSPTIAANQLSLHAQAGRYEEATSLLKNYEHSIPDAIKIIKGITLNVIRNVDRQLISFTDLPPEDWRPDLKKYESVAGAKERTCCLGSGDNDTIRAHLKTSHLNGQVWKFSNTAERPFMFAPNVFIWNGMMIVDKEYGVLLFPGTKIRWDYSQNGETLSRAGEILGWKGTFASKP